MTSAEVRERMKQAEARNARMDEMDRRAGTATPADCGPVEVLRTAIAALSAGITTRNWEPVEEATLLLGSLAEYRPWEDESPLE